MNMKEPTLGNIWCYKQNKVSLIVDDIVAEYPNVDRDFLYSVFFCRGIFKWLKVRRELIKLKNYWGSILACNNAHKRDRKLRGKIAQLVLCREAIRKLCRSSRWTVQDNDRKAAEWFNKLNHKNKTPFYFYNKKIWQKNIDLKEEDI